MDFHVEHMTSKMPSYTEKNEKVYITAGPKFGANLHGKSLIIDTFLYRLKTSASRFHEH
jgi:hypothetical protein